VKTGASLEPVGFDRTTRHNPRVSTAVPDGGCACANMQGLLSLNEVARRASMSTRFIRGRLREIPHYRASARGKIWIDWVEFRSWVRGLRADIGRDHCVAGILEEAGRKRSGSI